jgi:hypothetical protein
MIRAGGLPRFEVDQACGLGVRDAVGRHPGADLRLAFLNYRVRLRACLGLGGSGGVQAAEGLGVGDVLGGGPPLATACRRRVRPNEWTRRSDVTIGIDDQVASSSTLNVVMVVAGPRVRAGDAAFLQDRP